jgi:hypothetical protein
VWRAAFVNDDLHIFVTILLKRIKNTGKSTMNITIMKMMRAAVVGLFSPPQGLCKKNVNIWKNISGYFEHS